MKLTDKQIKDILEDWIMTIPLDQFPADEDYDDVVKSIQEKINDTD